MNYACLVKTNQKGPQTKRVPQITSGALCSFMSLKVNMSEGCWYLDSGCSRYMNSNISYSASPVEIDEADFIYGNSGKDKISEEGTTRI